MAETDPGRPAPPTGPESASTRSRRGLSVPLVALVGLLTAAGVAAAHALVSRTIPVPAGLGELRVGANAYALSELGGLTVPDSLSGQVLSVHVGLYGELAAAATRYTSVAGAARELLLVVSVVSALALFTLARQLGLSAVAAAAAALIAGLAPTVVSAQILLAPAAVAVMWLLLAAVLVSARPALTFLTWQARLLGALLVAVAGLLAPVTVLVPGGIVLAALLAGSLFPRWRIAFRVLLAGLIVAAVVVAGLLAPDTLAGAPSSPLLQATSTAVAVAGLGLALLVTWQVRWLAPVALGAVPIFVVALLPVQGQAAAVVAAIPVVALLATAFVEDVILVRRRPARQVWRLVAGAVSVAVVIGLVVLPASSASTETGTPQVALATWIDTNVAPDTAVQVSPTLWVELVRAGLPRDRLQRTDDPASGPVPTLLAETGQQHSGFPLVAQFGSGPLALSVRQRVPDADRAAAAWAEEQEASAVFGGAVRRNSNVVLRGTAGADLESGRVDSRLLTALATAAADFTFTIEAFPRVDGGADVGTLTAVRLSSIEPMVPSTSANSPGVQLRDYLRFQLPQYRPLAQGFDGGALVITYSAPSPVGLLG